LNRTALAVLAAAVTGVQVGAAITATRYVAGDISPASLAFLRYAIGVACLVPAIALAPRVRFARADIVPIALLGIAQFGVLIALLNYGLKTVPAGRGALILASFPLLTLIFAALAGHERITLPKLAGILLTLAGVAFALGDKIGGTGTLTGEIAILLSAVTGALCSVLYRPYLRRYPTLPVSAFAMAAAAGALLAPAALDDLFAAPAHLSATAWAAIVFIGLSSGGGYVLWLWALRMIAATRVTVFLALSPITAAVFGVLFLGEPVTAGMIAGVICVAAGLWVANRER
jgi:drug/metabolite transporter (DMT)-like permease